MSFFHYYTQKHEYIFIIKFYNIFNNISTADDFLESCDSYGLREKYKRILLEIISEYKNR